MCSLVFRFLGKGVPKGCVNELMRFGSIIMCPSAFLCTPLSVPPQSAIEAVSSAEAEGEEEGEEEADVLRSKQRRRRLSVPAHRFGVSSLFKQILREEGGRVME